MKKNKTFDFDVALSFAGHDRDYVESVAKELKNMEIRVFYDKYETINLWGKNLYDHFTNIYQNTACFTVIFISKYYAKSVWSNQERKSAQARALNESQEYILPARFDQTSVPGLLPTIGYVDLKDYSPKQLARLIKEKVGPIVRYEYFPDTPDRLFKLSNTIREKKVIYSLAYSFFTSFKLMTVEERFLLTTAINNACPAGLPENIHLNIDYLSRVTSMSIQKIKESFSRLDCLGFSTRTYKYKQTKDQLCKTKNIIEIKYNPFLEKVNVKNATFIAVEIINIIRNHICPKCQKTVIENVDFSILSSLVGFSESNIV